MAYCEDYPCCGHTPEDPCDYTGPTAADMSADPARYHLGCDHEAGECRYEEWDEDEEEEWDEEEEEWDEESEDTDDVGADAETLASAGWGTDEDYGHYGGGDDW